MNCCWSVPDKITIVESLNNRLYIDDESSIPKAYIVLEITKSLLKMLVGGLVMVQKNIAYQMIS